MAWSDHPATPDDAFARRRRTFVPRLLTAFALYAAAVYAPDIARVLSDLSAPEPDPAVTTGTPSAFPTQQPTVPAVVRPVLLDGAWVLDQAQGLGALTVGGLESEGAGVAQTFRAPEDGAALRVIDPSLHTLQGRMTVSVYELEGVHPTSGRRLITRALPRALGEVRLEEPIPLRASRLYSFVLRLAPPRDLFDELSVGFLGETDVYADGTPWIEDGGWRPLVGEMAFRLVFDPA